MNRFSGLCLLVAAGALLTVTGCGSVSGTAATARTARPSVPAAGTATGLCAAVSQLDALTVTRVYALPANHFRFRLPRQVVVSHPQQVRAVARAVCALPRMPRVPLLCPADFGVSYRLEFAAAGRRFGVVTVAAGGCGRVSGAGPARWAQKSPGFWTVLGRAGVVPWPGMGLDGCGGMDRLMCASRRT